MGNRRSTLVAVDDAAVGEQTAYSPSDLKMMLEFLPDFVHPHHSTKADQAIILEHWDKLFTQSTQPGAATAPTPMVVLFDTFYKHLFEIAPQVKPMFRSSMQVQGRALVRIVGSIKNMLQSPNIVEQAAALAKRHVQYGIKMPYFNALGLTLMKTFHSCSAELWTPDTERAWRKVYGHVALIVMTELRNADPSRHRSSLLNAMVSHRERRSSSTAEATHPHHGQTLNPNATCPMSGNRLKDMPTAMPAQVEAPSLLQRVTSVFWTSDSSTKYRL